MFIGSVKNAFKMLVRALNNKLQNRRHQEAVIHLRRPRKRLATNILNGKLRTLHSKVIFSHVKTFSITKWVVKSVTIYCIDHNLTKNADCLPHSQSNRSLTCKLKQDKTTYFTFFIQCKLVSINCTIVIWFISFNTVN